MYVLGVHFLGVSTSMHGADWGSKSQRCLSSSNHLTPSHPSFRFPRHKYLDSLRHALASGGPRNSMLLLLLACTKMYQQVVQVVQTLSWSHGKIGKIGKSQMDRFVRTLR